MAVGQTESEAVPEPSPTTSWDPAPIAQASQSGGDGEPPSTDDSLWSPEGLDYGEPDSEPGWDSANKPAEVPAGSTGGGLDNDAEPAPVDGLSGPSAEGGDTAGPAVAAVTVLGQSEDRSSEDQEQAGQPSSEVLSEDEGASEDPAPPSPARRRIRTASIVALYSVALIGIGVFVGWQAFARTTPSPPQTEVVEVPIVSAQSVDATMPDVRGLAESNARTALVDAGIPADRLSVSTSPAAGSPGIVVDQEPAYGTADPDAVTLVISTAAAVPDLAGESESDATAELLALGARVEVQREYKPGSQPGDVLRTRPKAGKAVGEAVTLTVAEPPASAYLTQLDTVDDSDSCGSQDQAVLSGTQYDNALSCTADTETREYTWLIADKADQFVATVGVPDDGDQDARASVRVVVDGQVKATGTASYTKPVPVDVAVAGGTQLQIRLTNPDSDDDDSGYFGSSSSVDVIVADGRLIGSSDSINDLAGWSQ